MYFLFNLLPIADVANGGFTFYKMILCLILGIILFFSIVYFIRAIKHKRHGDVYSTWEIVVSSSCLFFNIALVTVFIIGMFVKNNALFVLAIVYAAVIVVLLIASIIFIIKRYRIYGRDLGVDVDENRGLLAFSIIEMLLEGIFWLLFLFQN